MDNNAGKSQNAYKEEKLAIDNIAAFTSMKFTPHHMLLGKLYFVQIQIATIPELYIK